MPRPKPFPSSEAVRSFLIVAVLVAAAFGALHRSQSVALAQTSPTAGPLVQPSDLVYEGAFCLPQTAESGPGLPNSFHDGGTALAWDPYKQNLIVMGNYRYGNAARVTVPAPSTSSCPRGSMVGSWLDMQWRFPPSGEDHRIGGFLPQANGDLVVSWFIYYDANGSQQTSHVRISATGTVSSSVKVGSDPTGMVSGWMLPVPTEWQSLLGGPALTGNGSIPITSRTSQGPAAYVFNPADIPSRNPAPAKFLFGYPYDHPTLGTCETGLIWNCDASNTQRSGLVWPVGTRSILYWHQVCNVAPTYPGGGWACPGTRMTRLLAFDANDLLAVKNGQKAPWDVRPYANYDMPAPLAGTVPIGAAHDPATGRIFIAEQYGDGPQPKIHVYRANGSTASAPSAPAPAPAPAPTVDTSSPSVAITSPASGTVVTGSLTVAASASDDIGVAGVQFTLDGVNVGAEDTSAPYQVAWDTTKSGNSSHTLRAWARDAAGNSSSSAVTVTVNNATAPTDATAPTVSLTSPSEDTNVAGTTTLAASATDNVGVTAVQFTLNGVSLGEPVSAPFVLSWVTTTVPDGAYTLRAVARDAAGNSGQSAAREVTVTNAPASPEKDEDLLGGDGGGDDTIESGPGTRRAGDKARGRAGSRDQDGETWKWEGGRWVRAGSDKAPVRPLAGDGSTDASAPASGAGRQSLADRPGSKASGRGRTATADSGAASPAPTLMECAGTNPYESSAGQIGICANGEWTLVQGIRTWGTVRQRTLPTGQALWVIETDEAVYDVNGGLPETYRTDDLEILFEGWFRIDLKSALESAQVIEVRLITLRDQQ
jgi:hypothetical protein